MPLTSDIKTAYRGIFRRKVKNLSAILAIFLGVTLLIGVQITSATLSDSFLTSLTLTQGEVDLEISSGTAGGYLNSTDNNLVKPLVPDAVGIMPILLTSEPVLYGSQLQSGVDLAGIPLNYSTTFGQFYDMKGNVMNINNLLSENNSVIISKALAENLKINPNNFTSGILQTQFSKLNINGYLVNTTFGPVSIINNTATSQFLENFTIKGIYDSKPGIGSQTTSSAGRVIFKLSDLQQYIKYSDPQVSGIDYFHPEIVPNPLNTTQVTTGFPLQFVYNNTDKISSYYVAFKTDHFTTGEWTTSQLQAFFTTATKNNPQVPV